jgi:hypothetical protein
MVDAVRVIDENAAVAHGGMVNEQSIGIEHANVGHGMAALDRRHVPHLTGTGTGQRPRDPNGWLSLPAARGLGAGPGTEGARYFQAYQDKQYRTMTLLLRHLCIDHRIPRRFYGVDYDEVYAHVMLTDSVLRRIYNMSPFEDSLVKRSCYL